MRKVIWRMEDMDDKIVMVRVKKGDPNVTLGDILKKIGELQAEHPDMDIFWDGDEYAICGRKKKVMQDTLF